MSSYLTTLGNRISNYKGHILGLSVLLLPTTCVITHHQRGNLEQQLQQEASKVESCYVMYEAPVGNAFFSFLRDTETVQRRVSQEELEELYVAERKGDIYELDIVSCKDKARAYPQPKSI
ncbi:hypothetical protein HZA98_03645 [Candidatus Woesearchaeota archaeon]|nr:hypothetical protein [Candidatus Woesearchaeota archaeon]